MRPSANPFLGVAVHWLDGLASGSFMCLSRRKTPVLGTYWLADGIRGWIIAPWVIGLPMTNDLTAVFREAPNRTLFWCYFFGASGD